MKLTKELVKKLINKDGNLPTRTEPHGYGISYRLKHGSVVSAEKLNAMDNHSKEAVVEALFSNPGEEYVEGQGI